MQRLSSLIEAKVSDLEGGRIVGRVEDVAFSLQTGTIYGIFVKRSLQRKRHGFVPIASVKGIGSDAVTILSLDCVEKGVAKPKGLLGQKVMTRQGNTVGTVTDAIISKDERLVIGLELAQSFWEDLRHRRKIWPLSPDFVFGDAVIAPENYRSVAPEKLLEHARRLAPFSLQLENEEVCFLNRRDR